MTNVVRGQVRLAAITHQSPGQDPLKDTSCLNGKEKGGKKAAAWAQPTAPTPPFTLLQWSQGLAASRASIKYISLLEHV